MRRPAYELRLVGRGAALDVFELERLADGYVRVLVKKKRPPIIDEENRVAIEAPMDLEWRLIPRSRVEVIIELQTNVGHHP